MSFAKRARRHQRAHVRVCCFHPFHLCLCCVHLSSRFSPVPLRAHRIVSNDQCDGNQCCPSFEGVCAGITQEWSLRLNVPQHGETHQVLTVKIDRLTALFLIPRVVPRGRSQLVKSTVWLVPLVRIDRLIVMDHGAWPFFVDGVKAQPQSARWNAQPQTRTNTSQHPETNVPVGRHGAQKFT